MTDVHVVLEGANNLVLQVLVIYQVLDLVVKPFSCVSFLKSKSRGTCMSVKQGLVPHSRLVDAMRLQVVTKRMTPRVLFIRFMYVGYCATARAVLKASLVSAPVCEERSRTAPCHSYLFMSRNDRFPKCAVHEHVLWPALIIF